MNGIVSCKWSQIEILPRIHGDICRGYCILLAITYIIDKFNLTLRQPASHSALIGGRWPAYHWQVSRCIHRMEGQLHFVQDKIGNQSCNKYPRSKEFIRVWLSIIHTARWLIATICDSNYGHRWERRAREEVIVLTSNFLFSTGHSVTDHVLITVFISVAKRGSNVEWSGWVCLVTRTKLSLDMPVWLTTDLIQCWNNQMLCHFVGKGELVPYQLFVSTV